MAIITLYNLEILLSLHYFLTPQFRTFTNLLIETFAVSNPAIFFSFFEIGKSYVSIIVDIISDNAVLQCYLLWIFVSIRRILQLTVGIGVLTPLPSSYFLFLPIPFLSLQTIQVPLFRRLAPPPPPQKNILSYISPVPKNWDFQ